MFNLLLIMCLVFSFLFGYIVIQNMDKIFETEKQEEKEELLLLDIRKDEEILKEIHRFKKEHQNAKIMLCDAKILDHISFK